MSVSQFGSVWISFVLKMNNKPECFFYDGLRGVFEIKINNVIRNIKNNVFEIKKNVKT